MILVLHNRYRTPGGEERAIAGLVTLARESLGEEVELLERDSAALGRARASIAMLRGGLAPDDVAAAVRRTRADIVHAHNLNPAFGPRALLAARAGGARIVLQLHNYRLVCAVGTCIDARGSDCTRCSASDTRPGLRLNCRGSRPEAVVYAAALHRHGAPLAAAADIVVVPSAAARERLATLRAPVAAPISVVPNPLHEFAPRSRAGAGVHALVASRLAREKDVEVAIAACERVGLPLVIAGDGPSRVALQARAGSSARFVGAVDQPALSALRAQARVALVPSRAWETYGLAALEAMAAGVPVVASATGALRELAPEAELVAPGDVAAFAAAIARMAGDERRGEQSITAARRRAGAASVAPALAAVYATARTGT